MTTPLATTVKKKFDILDFGRVLHAAYQAAVRADARVDDLMGTCNFDSVAIVGTLKQLAPLLEAAGLSYFKGSGMWKGRVIVTPPTTGQGQKRTAAAEAMCKRIEAGGFKASVYYQMD
jgi:hypothetical protein